MIWLYISICIVVLIIGICLIPNKEKSLFLKIVTFPVVWVLSLIYGFLTFPVYYFKNKKYNNVKVIKCKVEPLENGKIKITGQDGKEHIIDGGKENDKIR